MQYIHVENHSNALLKTKNILILPGHCFLYLAFENKTTAAPGSITQRLHINLCRVDRRIAMLWDCRVQSD